MTKLMMFVGDRINSEAKATIRQNGSDPAWAYACREIDVPEAVIAQDQLLRHALWFAQDAPLGETGVIACPRLPGRIPLIARLDVTESPAGVPAFSLPM